MIPNSMVFLLFGLFLTNPFCGEGQGQKDPPIWVLLLNFQSLKKLYSEACHFHTASEKITVEGST